MARTRKASPGSAKDVPSDKGQAGETPPAKETDSTVVRVEADIAHKLKVVSSMLNKSISEIISPILRPIIERLYAEEIRRAASAVEEKRS